MALGCMYEDCTYRMLHHLVPPYPGCGMEPPGGAASSRLHIGLRSLHCYPIPEYH